MPIINEPRAQCDSCGKEQPFPEDTAGPFGWCTQIMFADGSDGHGESGDDVVLCSPACVHAWCRVNWLKEREA